MKKGEKYETDEAREILTNARSRLDPTAFEAAKTAAARDLLTAVLKVVADAGYTLKPDKDGVQTVTLPSRLKGVWVVAHALGIRLGTEAHGLLGKSQEAAIEYDASHGVWVGTAIDTRLVPMPGHVTMQKRSAVAVVAEAIVALLESAKP